MAQEPLSISDVLVARKRITGFVTNTPLRKSHWMSDVSQAEVWMKLENLQVTGSFKYRGALNAMT
ncbi:MAG: pyridoxal-phosphate dependent enzyme, partial [Elusimicrobia bacterium]|nr:pyridoxal-phosphate dependent enzyme [Elusimicrobiota bacterium]